MKPIYLVGLVLILFGVASSVGMAQEEWMPDPNLRQAVREALELPPELSFCCPGMGGYIKQTLLIL